MTTKTWLIASSALAFLATLGGAGLLASELIDTSDTTEKHADSGTAGKADGLLAAWVPDSATDVRVLQRTTGNERLLTFTYDGGLPAGCTAVAKVGTPSGAELRAAYDQDDRTRDSAVTAWATSTTLDATWWPEHQVARTTDLCGRWWVSHTDDTWYAFAAEAADAA